MLALHSIIFVDLLECFRRSNSEALARHSLQLQISNQRVSLTEVRQRFLLDSLPVQSDGTLEKIGELFPNLRGMIKH